MYSFHEIRKICARCKDYIELEQASVAFGCLINQGAMTDSLEAFTRREVQVRFRQLKV